MMASVMRVLSYAVPALQATAEVARTVKETQESSTQSAQIRRQHRQLAKEREQLLEQFERIKSEIEAERLNLRRLEHRNAQLKNKINFLQTLLAVTTMIAVGLLIAFFFGYMPGV